MRVRIGILVVCLIGGSAGTAWAGESEIVAAKRKANEVARRLSQARGRVEALSDDLKEIEARAADVKSERDRLSSALGEMAVSRYMQGEDRNRSTNLGADDLNSEARAGALARLVSGDASEALDAYRKSGEDLESARAALDATKRSADQALVQMKKRSREVQVELARLEKLEAERRAREEAARKARERQARVAKARMSVLPSNSSGAALGGDGWLCPVQGAVAFSNDWGDPRSGGRSHQGTDMLAARGTPVVASVSGTVRAASSARGGISYYLAGDDGNTYFGAHLSSLSGAAGRVERGTVLGAVGNSGNASGGPNHLHFEIHPGGGAPTNPYPTVARYC